MEGLEYFLKKERECPITGCKFIGDYEHILSHVQEFHQIKILKILDSINKDKKVINQISVRWKK